MMALLCCTTVLLLLASGAYAWPPPVDGHGWSDVSDQVFPPTVAFPVRPSSLVDWNGDKFVDFISIGTSAAFQDVFSIWMWTGGNNSFTQFYQSSHLSTSAETMDPIANTVAADFNRDGIDDIVALMSSGALWILDGGSLNLTRLDVSGIDITKGLPQLSAVNAFGECALPDLVISGDHQLYVLRNNLGSTGNCDYVGGVVSFTPQLINAPGNVVPLSVQAVDITGTCNAQLVFATQKTSGAQKTYFHFDNIQVAATALFSVPSYAGIPSMFDANADGSTDFIFPYCDSTDTACQNGSGPYSALLFVYSNVQGSVCGEYDCCAGFQTTFSDVAALTTSGAGWDVVSLQDVQGCAGLLSLPLQSSSSGLLPMVIRSGDYNRDSYRDLILTTNAGPVILTRSNGASLPPLFTCNSLLLGNAASGDMTAIPFFFDLAEDGRLDVLLIHTNASIAASGTVPAIGISALWNGMVMREDYFLTALALNGVNVGNAPASTNTFGVGFPAYGASQLGAVHRFEWQDIETNARAASYVQQGFTQAHSLENPRVHFGLGRTFSYIQNYAVGIHYMPSNGNVGTESSSLHYTWPSYLIPNSQVVVIPYPLLDPSSWQIKLFLSTSEFQTTLLIALSTALFVIGIPIVVLKVREVREDMAESKRHN